jgi:hypothetical protein
MVLAEVQRRTDAAYAGPMVTLDVGLGEVTATAMHPFWVVRGEDLENRPKPGHSEISEWHPCLIKVSVASMPNKDVRNHFSHRSAPKTVPDTFIGHGCPLL